ncbi:MAG: SH3 domain-containing protein [Ectobacillus sp.]
MKSNALAVSAITLAALPLLPSATEASTGPSIGYVTATSLNVRAEPAASSSKLGALSKNSSVQILGKSGDWYKIQYQNRNGFVHQDYISASANQGGQQYFVKVNALNIRSQPGTYSSILGTLTLGQAVSVQSEHNGWYKISYQGRTGYIKNDFVSSSPLSLVKGVSTQSYYYVDCSSLRVRSGPDTNYSILGSLQNGQQVQVIGETSNWYKIKFGGKEGYISKRYVKPSQNQTSTTQATSAFKYPAASGYISSKFGMRWGQMHYGIDIAAPGNVQILAAAAGTVTKSYYSSSYGNVVFVSHRINGQLYTTVYAHMKNRAVKEGDTVKQGQFLGYMGNTGNSLGQHLHFELHKGEWTFAKTNAIDPLPYIQR